MKRWLGLGLVAVPVVAILVWGWRHLQGGDQRGADSVLKLPLDFRIGPPPKIALTETTYNFGTMDQDQIASHIYEIGNEGPGELSLRIANTSCGCTRVKLGDLVWNPKDEEPPPRAALRVRPAEKVELELAWSTELKSGPFRTSARLDTNDPDHRQVNFFIEGEVMPFIEVSQKQIQMDPRNSEVSIKTFEIFSRKVDHLELTAETSSPLVQVSFEPAPEEFLQRMSAKCGYTGIIQIEPGLPIGPFNAKLTIHTDCPERPVMTVALTGRVEGDVILTPEDKLSFKIIRAGEGATLGLFVKIVSRSPVEVKVGKVVPEFLKVTLKQSETGRSFYQLKAQVPPGAPGGIFRGVIELETDHPTARVIQIPVFGEVVK